MTAQSLLGGYPSLPGFAKETRELVYAMLDAGWTGRVTSKNHWLGRAPDGTTTITVPSKVGNNRGFKNASAAFMRWVKAHMPAEERELFDKAKAEEDPLVKDVLAESLVRKQGERIMHERDERIHKAIVEAIRTEEIGVSPKPTVRPYLARKHSGKDGGTRYESQTTLERDWGNGIIDYVCALTGCDYDSGNPRSVAMHYGQEHTRKGETAPAGEGAHVIDPEYTEPLTSRYRPTERLLNTLAEFLAEHSWDNVDDLALLFLTWANERPDLEHESRPLVPLTDKQILDKIRMLVGQPDQTETIESLTGELIETRRQRDEANAHLVKVEKDIAALRDMLEGVGR